ncbi:MAG: response regulator transcription factor [Bacteroidota bacterium]|nr:response regulator transcription factor [Bacteroidota bacterium]
MLRKIAVADAQVLTREGLISLIRGKDYEIVAAVETKEELFGLVKKTPPDLLILDYDQVHNLLKIHLELLVREFPASRILMISSNIQHENVSMILQLGITHFIHKRCNKDELVTAIKAAFRNENY